MSTPLVPGEILAGKYRIDRKLGEGGMGVVFAATHLALEKPRAIKLLRAEIAANAEARRRFLREARAASELSSRHVARVFDVDWLPSGEPYFVMEYLEGADLASVLAAHGPLPAAEAALHVRQACDALAEAHARGLVHRDVKLANLFLAKGESGPPLIKVLDFGIVKALEPSPGGATEAGAFLGTLRSSAPEQIECSASVDARADIWALGVALYELVTGAPPFESPSLLKLVALVTECAPMPPSERVAGLPAGFDGVILRCLEKDRERRFATAGELAEALRAFAAEGEGPGVDRLSMPMLPRAEQATVTAPPLVAPAPESAPSPVRPARRSRGAVGVAAVALAAMVIAGVSRAPSCTGGPVAVERSSSALTVASPSSAPEPLPSSPAAVSSSLPPPPSPSVGARPSASPALPRSNPRSRVAITPPLELAAPPALPVGVNEGDAAAPSSTARRDTMKYDVDGNPVPL